MTTKMHDKKLFIGGLPSEIKEEEIKNYFSRFGRVEKCSLILDKNTGRSRCFGFITMINQSSVKVILNRKHSILGKEVECKPAVPKDKSEKNNRSRKIFVGGLLPEITNSEFFQFFQQFGEIEDSVVMKDRVTGKPRGFGFVTFYKQESVEKVMRNFSNNFIHERWVECKRATPKDEMGNSATVIIEPDSSSSEFTESEFKRWWSGRNSCETEELCRSLVDYVLSDDDRE
ncbi:unnamed protein product [Blepharisma stoltei]|uniref:RRM domain-containing protein n=1 Tax=Blepharisma stoltei TaxID=1481888 RepID=A0AAU9JSD3_9CILI|nr:unnamed protein product [Blepharisma stoltei]